MVTRDNIQSKAINSFREHRRLILEWCTGLGKSKAAINIIKDLDSITPDRNIKVLLVVAEIAHKNNWKEEFDKWQLSSFDVISNIDIVTYASLKNYRGSKYDLIVLDEGHHSGSVLRLDILSDIKADNVLVLSATLSDSVIDSLNHIYGEFTVFKVTLKEAVGNNIIPKPDIRLVPLNLDNTSKSHEIIVVRGKSAKRVKLNADTTSGWHIIKNKLKYPDIELHMTCTAKEKYFWLESKSEYWKRIYTRNGSEIAKNKWLQYGSARKKFLGELKSNYAKKAIRLLEDKRYICFCSSIKQAELLGKDKAIHSLRKDSLSVINDFNSKKINELFAVGMIQEGQNLVDIDAGVIIQLDGTSRIFIQKLGRILRSKNPIVYILYFENTRDMAYLSSMLENVDEEYVKRIYL